MFISRKKEISIRRIAQECEVSTATVSRVLHEPEKVAEATRKKILAALEAHHYQPTPMRRPVNLSDAPLKIGILITSSISFYYTNLVQHVSNYFTERDMHVICANTQEWEDYIRQGKSRRIYFT